MHSVAMWYCSAAAILLFFAAASRAQDFVANTTHYNIDLRYQTPVTDEVRQVFEAARHRWESVIINDLDTTVQIMQGQDICGVSAPAQELVDDLLIYVFVANIDGTGNVLARAGPCAVDSQQRIRVGIMQFDLADLERLMETNRAQATVLHEMGHVLGFGTLWEQLGLIGEPDDDDHELEDYDIRYLGEQGNIGNEEVGMQYEAVVEDSGGAGTEKSHWEEDIYENELMTGYVPEDGIAPMSVLTIRAMADLGYIVDPTKADTYEVDDDIVDDLEWDDLRAVSKDASPKKHLRVNKDRKKNKESYGQDIIRMELKKLDGESRKPGR